MTIRITIADEMSTVSFLTPGHAIKMFVAACSHDVESVGEMLDVAGRLDRELISRVRHGLMKFDEHNVKDDFEDFKAVISNTLPDQLPPFRVFSPELRNASLNPGRLGLILFNLRSKRIVQVQNHYAEISRADRGRIWIGGEPVRRLYRYELSSDWALLP